MFNKKLGSMPSHQSREHGYIGMIMIPAVYALRCNVLWADFPDPSPHRTIDPAVNPAGQVDALVDFNFRKGVCNSKQNFKAVVIATFNYAVPPEYRRIAGAMGTREFRITDSPKLSMQELRRVYGKLRPSEKNEY